MFMHINFEYDFHFKWCSIKNWTIGSISGAGTVYASRPLSLPPGFSVVRIVQPLVFCICLCILFLFLQLCVVCHSLMSGFWLLIWYPQSVFFSIDISNNQTSCNISLLIKSPKQRLETYCFCSVSYYYYYYSCSCYSPFFPCTMNLSTADLRNYKTEFHETRWSYRYMFLVDPTVFRFVVKGVKAIFFGGFKRGGGYYRIIWENWNFVH